MSKTRKSEHPVEFGLIAWLESTRIALPLKGVECAFEVTGAVASVELDQIFHQTADRPLDCTYTFPLPAGSAVYRCELHVNGRVVRAKVEEQGAARRIFRKQKAAGRRAALVETERENLFTLSLGNVQPGDLIIVRLAWFQVLDRLGGDLRLRVPTCPGVRYIPGKPLLRSPSGRGVVDDTDQVPDASRITPPRIDALHPDAAYFAVEGRLALADIEHGGASSPSHAVNVREDEGFAAIELATRAAVPDRDFILAWREAKARQLSPVSWIWRGPGESYALVQLRAPETVAVAGNYQQDVYFLVDRSGSMAGAKWRRTCEALHAFVRLLGENDRVWITLFESAFQDFAEAPLPAGVVLADRGFQTMPSLGTAGGTELLPAAKHVLDQIARHSTDRPTSVVLITDGQVGNEDEIRRVFRAAPSVRVHTFGIDTAVNDAFLKSLARQQRGGCCLQTPNDDIVGAVAKLGDRLRRPVLTGLKVKGAWEIAAGALPDLHAGEVAALSFRGMSSEPLQISGSLPDGRIQELAAELTPTANEGVRLLWARERIEGLLESGQSAEAIALAQEFNLVCKGAAFVAWDEAEQIAVAREEIVQPAQEVLLRSMPPILCSAPLPRRCMSLLGEELGSYVSREEAPELHSRTAMAWAHALNSPEVPIHPGFNDLVAAFDLIEAGKKMPRTRKSFEKLVTTALRGSADGFFAWAASAGPKMRSFSAFVHTLEEKHVPQPLIDGIFAWCFLAIESVAERLTRIESFIAKLQRPRFSTHSESRLWAQFLAENFDDQPDIRELAIKWLPEIAQIQASAAT